MLFKFKSKAAGDLIMLEANGRRVLQMIGKDPSATGIILPAQMPAAIAALETAVASEEADEAKGAAPTTSDAVPLRQRALPFIELLKTCHRAGAEIVWGV